jgi:hypothetical protein
MWVFDLPKEKPKHVAIVDIGNSGYSVPIVAFTKSNLQVKETA